jgi:hypothetical protein
MLAFRVSSGRLWLGAAAVCNLSTDDNKCSHPAGDAKSFRKVSLFPRIFL